MKRKIHILTTLCLLFSATAVAQNSNILYGVTRIPQMNNVNPAFFPINTKTYTNTFGLNITGSMPMSLNELILDTTIAGQRYNYIDATDIIDQLKANNQFNIGLNMTLPGFGFKTGKMFFTIGLQSQFDAHVGIPIEILNLVTEGNSDISGAAHTTHLVKGDLIGLQGTFAIPIGVGLNLKNLSVGFRIKPVIGLFNVNTNNTYVDLHTTEGLNKMMADVHYNLQIAIPCNLNLPTAATLEELPDYLNISSLFQGFSFSTMQPNLGLGLDLGAKYDFHGFEFSASVLDLGRIKWKNAYNVHPANGAGEFAFEGIEVTDLINGGSINMDSIVQIYEDEANELLNATFSKGEAYSTSLNPKFNVGVFYKVPLASKIGINIRAGLHWHGKLMPRMGSLADAKSKMLYQNVTALAAVNLFDWLEITASNSLIYNGNKTSIFNPGASVNIMLLRRLQFFALIDYGAFNFTDAKEINAFIGTNVLVGHRKLQKAADATAFLPQSNNYLL